MLGGAAAWPLAARAQEPGRTYRLGVLAIGARQQSPPQVAFFDELQLSGFIEGQNLVVLPDGFGVPVNQLAARAAAMVRLAPDVLVGVGPAGWSLRAVPSRQSLRPATRKHHS